MQSVKEVEAQLDLLIDQFLNGHAYKKKEEAQVIFESATAFYEGALRCIRDEKIGGETLSPVLAGIVSFAFAIELYTKAQLVSNGNPLKGHKLDILFQQLDNTVRVDLAKRYKDLIGDNDADIDADIVFFANAFVDWRYVFERNSPISISVNRLAILTCCFYSAISDRHPAWAASPGLDNVLKAGPAEHIVVVKHMNTGEMFRAKLA